MSVLNVTGKKLSQNTEKKNNSNHKVSEHEKWYIFE